MKAYTALRLRTENRARALRLLIKRETLSRTLLARELHISAPTAGKLVDYFLQQGIAEAAGAAEAEQGRPAVLVRLAPLGRVFAGALADAGEFKAGLFDMRGSLLTCGSYESRSFQQGIRALPDFIGGLCEKINVRDINGLGLGLPAIYDDEWRLVVESPALGLRGAPIGELLDSLSACLGCPVTAGNAVNYCALGELSATGGRDLAYISLGNSLGAAFVLDGKLLIGTRDRAGEIGYTRLTPDGEHLEELVTLPPVLAHWKLENEAQLTAQGEAVKRELSEYICRPLALCIANLGAALDIRGVVVGGRLPRALGRAFFETLNAKLAEYSHFMITALAETSENSDISGAALAAMDKAMDTLLEGSEALLTQ